VGVFIPYNYEDSRKVLLAYKDPSKGFISIDSVYLRAQAYVQAWIREMPYWRALLTIYRREE